jgi:hypothetical protein
MQSGDKRSLIQLEATWRPPDSRIIWSLEGTEGRRSTAQNIAEQLPALAVKL